MPMTTFFIKGVRAILILTLILYVLFLMIINSFNQVKLMKTSIEIDDYIFSEAKKLSISSKKTFGKIVEEALRNMMLKKRTGAKSKVSLVTMKGNGLQHGIDLDNNQSLADIMDD